MQLFKSFCDIIINEIKCFNKVGKFIIFIFVLMIYTYKLFKHFHLQVKSSVCQQNTVTECIFYLLDPSTDAGGGQLLLIFIDLVSTNILLAMLGFLLSQKGHADFCFKLSWLFCFIYSELHFYFFDDLHLQIIASISPKASVENSSAQWAIFLYNNITHHILSNHNLSSFI